MKSTKPILVLIAGLVLLNTTLHLFKGETTNKIGFVRSQDIVNGFEGMQVAKDKFETLQLEYVSRLDTLQADYEEALASYKHDYGKLSAAQRKDRQRYVAQQQENYERYSATAEAELKEKEGELMGRVLNQINSFVMEYGKNQGYSMVFGTTVSGSILYGDDAIDLTEEISQALNATYSGK